MEDKAFLSYRNEVIASLNKHDVEYKLVGGSVVQLIDSSRKTVDLDMLISKTKENLRRFIAALVDCGFASEVELRNQIFGSGRQETPDEAYDAFQLESSNPRWGKFHLDMCFQLGGKFTYENSHSETHTTDTGLKIRSVPYKYVAHMKANVWPQPRPRDIEDIHTIADHLGIDPVTGEPIKTAEKNKRFLPLRDRNKKKGRDL